MISLDKIEQKKRYIISGYNTEDAAFLRRFYELGLVKGRKVQLYNRNLGNVSMLVLVDNYLIGAKHAVFKQILVKEYE